MGNKAGKLVYFGAYFNDFDRLFIPTELSEAKNEHKRKKMPYETYLSFVNDKKNIDGSVVLKDTEILRRLLSNEAFLDKHIDDIISLTQDGGYDGIEIDYERVWKDEPVGKLFVQFVNKLYPRARDKNLKLRVVLEPNTPFSGIEFANGPEYVVMFYNLYGLHSEAGPKANSTFIQKLLSQIEILPGEKSVAFATGGCSWGSNGKKQLVTEAEAKVLSGAYDAAPQRDKDSQSLFFEYENDGVKYQVWYADVKTLNYWSSLAKERGIYKISLWRLGGNSELNKIK
jgi:spore germination protein YaaH